MTLRPNNLHVYNTLTRSKVRFEPLAPPAPPANRRAVGMYVCGPTVYGDAHIGHAKSYVSFDVIVRYLRYLGYNVRYVQNITDVGHLTDDADAGEDKVEKKARAERVHPMQIAEMYTRRYFEDMDRLNVLRPDISPRASGHIIEQIELVRRLLERGHAYEVGGNVYFDVASWPKYGRLSGRSVDEMMAGARVEPSADKRAPADFALWKRADPGHIMQWPSPWGMGYPGWHLECSAMSMKYLGESFDIHGGGIENQFPHHEDEIAQAEAATGKPFAKYWIHNNMVTVGGQKMGKSLGNFITLKDAFKKWDPMVLRLFILQSHYRSPLDFSDKALGAAKSGHERLRTTVDALRKRLSPYGQKIFNEIKASVKSLIPGLAVPDAIVVHGLPETVPSDVNKDTIRFASEALMQFQRAMDDDFNTPTALAAIFDLVRDTNRLLSEAQQSVGTLFILDTAFRQMAGDVLGLIFEVDSIVSTGGLDSEAVSGMIDALIAIRNGARKDRNFALADDVRKRLDVLGIALEDTPEGTKWRFK